MRFWGLHRNKIVDQGSIVVFLGVHRKVWLNSLLNKTRHITSRYVTCFFVLTSLILSITLDLQYRYENIQSHQQNFEATEITK